MVYTPQTWVDGTAGGTPYSAARLNYMESGIAAASGSSSAPLGYVASANLASDTSPVVNTEVNLNSMSAVSARMLGTSRRVRIDLIVEAFTDTAGDELRIRLYDGATALRTVFNTFSTAFRDIPFPLFYTASGWSGTHTLKVTALRTSGSGNVTVQAASCSGLIVTDIGV